MKLGPVSYLRTIAYRVRYTTTDGIVHETGYPNLKAALADSHYPVNDRKELRKIITSRQIRQVLDPRWNARKLEQAQ